MQLISEIAGVDKKEFIQNAQKMMNNSMSTKEDKSSLYRKNIPESQWSIYDYNLPYIQKFNELNQDMQINCKNSPYAPGT